MVRRTEARATVLDVARLAGVSAKTVSRVLAGEAHVLPRTRERVMDAARALHYRPNTVARDLRRGGVTSTIACVIGDLRNPFYMEVAAGVERELSARGFTMVLASSEDDATTERRVLGALLSQRVRAVIMAPVAPDQSYLAGDQALGTPIVALDSPLNNVTGDCVMLDNATGARDATRMLLEVGHRRIALALNPPDSVTHTERLHGYREAMREAGIADTSAWECLGEGPGHSLQGALEALLAGPDAPSAVLTCNNLVAGEAIHAMLPGSRDVALVSFDDFPLADALGLSVVGYDAEELGRCAASLAVERLGEPDRPPVEVRVPMHVVRRGSELRGLA